MTPPPLRDRLGTLAWRLGLGWLVGRRYLLLSTTGGDAERRTLLPYVLAAGDVYLTAAGGEPWLDDLGRTPRATVQAGPGSKGMRGRRLTDAAEVRHAAALHAAHPRAGPRLVRLRARGVEPVLVVLEPTGQITPGIVTPDLVWLWGAAAALVVLRRRRSAGDPRSRGTPSGGVRRRRRSWRRRRRGASPPARTRRRSPWPGRARAAAPAATDRATRRRFPAPAPPPTNW